MPKGSVAHKRLRFLALTAGAKAHGYGNHTFPDVEHSLIQSLRKMRLFKSRVRVHHGF